MPKPEYPTREGLWSRGGRTEESYAKVKLGTPYPDAVSNLRKAMEQREDFDPAVLFVWGTMQATGVLNTLKAVEQEFGEAGQRVVRKAIAKAGYEACKGLVQNSQFPEDVDDIELLSYIVTGINTVLYASLERPWIVSDDRCDFDILWCPHQDRYTAFDCRVQRYFVEGMIRALEELGKGRFVPIVDKLIPHGAEHCHFKVERLADESGPHPWDEYSDQLEKRALKKQRKENNP